MDFAKKYPITQQPGEHVLVQWTRGYKQVEVYYKNELVGTADGAARLKKGVRLVHPTLGNIDLKLAEKPVVINVIVDGYHSPVNSIHPVKELIGLSAFFWMLLAFSFIAGALEIGLFMDFPPILIIVAPVNIALWIVYTISVLGVRKGKPWAYILGVSVFGLFTVLSLLVLLSGVFGGVLSYMFEIIRFGALGIFLYNLKTVNAAAKHLKYGALQARASEDLLDTTL